MDIEERHRQEGRQNLSAYRATLSADASLFISQLSDECQFLLLDQLWHLSHCPPDHRDWKEGYAMGSVRYAFKTGHLTQAGYNMLTVEISKLRNSLDAADSDGREG